MSDKKFPDYSKLLGDRERTVYERTKLRKYTAIYTVTIYSVEMREGVTKYALAYSWENNHGTKEIVVSMPEPEALLGDLKQRSSRKVTNQIDKGYEIEEEYSQALSDESLVANIKEAAPQFFKRDAEW